jgi:hypothetical protein
MPHETDLTVVEAKTVSPQEEGLLQAALKTSMLEIDQAPEAQPRISNGRLSSLITRFRPRADEGVTW